MSSPVSPQIRQQVADRAYHVCEYCLIHEEDTFWGFEVDHIISRKHGGATVRENLAWACACCNAHKGTDLATLVGHPPKLVRLFHPRSDAWGHCFCLSGTSIASLNDIGRATEKLLDLNNQSRVRERKALAEAGRWPTTEALARMKE